MLQRLILENIGLIDRLELTPGSGLTVVTGETGAGKSLLLDGLSLILGERAESGLIRQGTSQAMVMAQFLLPPDHPARLFLQERELRGEEELLHLRRVLRDNGRNTAFINEIPVPVAVLKELGDRLADLHGQHDHQSLLAPEQHAALLDAHGGLAGQAAEVAALCLSWRALRQEREALLHQVRDAAERKNFLEFQLQELQEAMVLPGEEGELAARKGRLSHLTRLAASSARALERLAGEGGALLQLKQSVVELERDAHLDAALAPLAATFEGLRLELEEAVDRLDHYGQTLEPDPGELVQIEERLEIIHALARKHRTVADELPVLAERIAGELEGLKTADARIDALEDAAAAARERYEAAALLLSAARKQAAERFGREVGKQLTGLHLAGCRIGARLQPVAGDPRPGGREEVAFEFGANPGEPLKPLRQVASGGELSRVMLAIKCVLARESPIRTLIFDEVDVGVGGRQAAGIGERLRLLSTGLQVIAITHHPQVAAFGSDHWKVEKRPVAGRNVVAVAVLDDAGRVEELARMLAADQVGEKARENAMDLLEAARKKVDNDTGSIGKRRSR